MKFKILLYYIHRTLHYLNICLQNSKLPLRLQMEILYFFGTDMQVFEVEKFTSISHVSIIEWYKKLRILCKSFLEKDPISLGTSEGSIIEIDESLFGKKRKYHRGTGNQVYTNNIHINTKIFIFQKSSSMYIFIVNIPHINN